MFNIYNIAPNFIRLLRNGGTTASAGGMADITFSGIKNSTTEGEYKLSVELQDNNFITVQRAEDSNNFILSDANPPGTITNLTGAGTASEGEARLNWTAPGDDAYSGTASHYRIRYQAGASFDWNSATVWTDNLAVGDAAGTSETTVLTGLTKETTYYFGIRTVDNNNSESATASAALYIKDLTAPNAVNNLTAVSNGWGGQIELSWSSPGDDGGSGNIANGQWRIKSSTDSAYSFNVSDYQIAIATNCLLGSTQKYTITGLNGGTTYYLRVWARDNDGNWSANSNSANAYTALVRRLVFTSAPLTVSAGSYSPLIATVQLQDENNNPVNVSQEELLTFASSSSGGKFSLNKLVNITETPLIPGQNSVSFYYSDTILGSPTLTVAHKTANWYAAAQAEQVTFVGIDHFTVDCATSGEVGIGRAVTVSARDIYNNTVSSYTGTVNLSNNGNMVLPSSLVFAGADQGIKVVQGIDYYVETAKITAVESTNSNIRGESLISSRPFSLGLSSLDGFSETCSEQAKIYYLACDINLTADTSKTIGLKIPDISYLTVSSRKIGMNNFPINGKDVVVNHSLRTMELLVESKTKSELSQGTRNAVIEKYTVRTASGAATLTFTVSETVTDISQSYYLTYDLSNIAQAGATLGASGSDTDFDLGADAVEKTGLPYNSDLGLIIPTVDTLMITAADLMPAQIKQGNKTRAMAKLRLQSSANGVVLRSIKVKKTGTLPETAVTTVKIYKADVSGTGFVDIGGGTTAAVRLVSGGTDTFINGEASLSLVNSEVIDTGGRDFYLLAELSEEAGLNETFGLKIDTASISIDEPDLLDNTGLPFETKTAVLVDNPDSLTFTGTDLAAGKSAIQGREYPVLKLSASVNQDSAEISDLSYLEVVIPDKVENINFPIVSSTVAIKDGKTPTTTVITDDGLYTSNQTTLHARWTAQVFSGAIGESLCAVGTSSSTTDVVSWTTLANSLEVTRPGLFLQNGITYYFSVKVRSSLGDYWSDTGVSDGITVDVVKPQLKEKPKVVEVVKKGLLNDVTIQLPAAESGVSGITQYEIQQRETKSPVWKTIKIVIVAASAGKYSADSSLGYLLKITLYDLLGYFVREISAEGNPGSNNNISWDGTDEDGRKVAQGMYLAVIEAKGADGSKTKMVRRIGVLR